jgi:ribose/xylose/arabinose/galactoside ABC-type transport system permease subunit
MITRRPVAQCDQSMQSTKAQETGSSRAARPRRGAAGLLLSRRLAVFAAMAALAGAVCIANPSFASFQNLRDLLTQAAPVVIVGCGMTIVVLTGEIDISVGSLLGFLAMLLGLLSSPSHLGLPAPAVVTLTLAAGTLVGLLNGLLVTVGRVPSIVATLGMLTILRGATELMLGGSWITDLPPGVRALGTRGLAGIPICVWAAIAVTAILGVVLHWTALGARTRAVGDNASAAALARISVVRVKLLAFTIVGLLTGIAALVCVPQQSVIESGIGVGFELVVVTAVVVGGTSIRGGVGGIAGTVLAALLLGSIRTALIFLNVGEMGTYWERAIQGGFILAAVLADHIAARRRGAPEGVAA